MVLPKATQAASFLVAPLSNISEYTSVLEISAIYARAKSAPSLYFFLIVSSTGS
uniref:Uncharacterized protein n=1 Tax=Podoviridae sp. ct8Lf7 TaxID=2827723 RepID=A0A8S5S1E8_9CAUD|nr:MAG TPA: hypothetical protein [Podoviridae sp. ct8Lf7]